MNVEAVKFDIAVSDAVDSGEADRGRPVAVLVEDAAESLPCPTPEVSEPSGGALGATDEEVSSLEPELCPSISLAEYYQSNLLEQKRKGANERTCKSHLGSARKFDEFAAGVYPGRSIIEVLETEVDLLERFARWQFETHQSSVATVSKCLMQLQMVTSAMIKDDTLKKVRSNELPKKHLTKISREILGEQAAERRIPSMDEIAAIANVVDDTLNFPYKSHAPRFWQGWIQFCATYGPRCRDVVSADPDRPEKRGLLKPDVCFETACPIEDVNSALGETLHSPHGWLHYAIGKDHSSDNKRILLPMSQTIRSWVEHFIDLSPAEDDRVFPGSAVTKFLSQRPISERWNSLLAKAGVDPSIRLSEGKGAVLAVRKSAANWWRLQTERVKKDTRLAENVADYLLHHATTTTSTKHYLSVQAWVLPVMIEILPTFPVLGAGNG